MKDLTMREPTKTRSVFKYPVLLTDIFSLDLPEGAKVLSVDVQRGEPQLWALCDATMSAGMVTPSSIDGKMSRRRFRVAGTGHPIHTPADKLEFIGTFMLHGGELVFHLFEIKD